MKLSADQIREDLEALHTEAEADIEKAREHLLAEGAYLEALVHVYLAIEGRLSMMTLFVIEALKEDEPERKPRI